MSARSRRTRRRGRLWFLPGPQFLARSVLAAPYADPKLVEAWSRMDEFHAARGISKAASPLELKRTATPPQLEALLDDFLDAHRNTGLLVLKGDTILAERYQYGRTAGHRFASASVAKTVLGMLVGIAVHEKKTFSGRSRGRNTFPRSRAIRTATPRSATCSPCPRASASPRTTAGATTARSSSPTPCGSRRRAAPTPFSNSSSARRPPARASTTPRPTARSSASS